MSDSAQLDAAGRKPPAKANKKGVTFKLVQQSYEDKDYDESAPKSLLVPAALADQRFKKRRKQPLFVFDEDLPEDFSNRRNMLMADDTRPGEEHLFDDEVEEPFDEDFIHEMMYGEVEDDEKDLFDDEDDTFEDEEAYPKHDVTQRAIDKQFTKMMREFEVDEDINDAEIDDPRTHGPLEVDQYMTALEEFVEDNAGYDRETAEPRKNKGLINQLKMMAHRNRIFDSNSDGVFVTTLLPDKVSRFMAEFKQQTDEIHRQAKESYEAKLRSREERAARGEGLDEQQEGGTDGPSEAAETAQAQGSDSEEEFEYVEIRAKEKMDCETVLSTYSTLYNHPNIIAAARRKMNPETALALEMKRRRDAALKRDEVQDSDEDEPAGAETRVQQLAELGIDVTVRPKDESAEEKKLRRKLVKDMQRERREEKKNLKNAYKDATLTHQVIGPVAKQSRTQMSLTVGGVISAANRRK